MKAFKREIVRLLVEYTGRPELFKRIRWTDGNPLMATHEYLGFTLDYINKTSNNDNHLNDLVLGNYLYYDDTIFMKTPTQTITHDSCSREYTGDIDQLPEKAKHDLCLCPDAFSRTLNNLLHEVAHRVQYYNGYRNHRDTATLHGKEFQEACLELGLDPSYEAYGTNESIEHDKCTDDFYVWIEIKSMEYFTTALQERVAKLTKRKQ